MVLTRYQEWASASRYVGEASVFAIDAVNGLGLIDEQLVGKEAEVMVQFQGISGPIDTPISLELRTLSHLWVLGAYEVVRVLSNWTRRDATISFGALSPQLVELKHRFERLRIPLAKQEVARRHKDTDSPFAFPILLAGYGVAWRVSDTTIISRRELADGFLVLLKKAGCGT